MVCLYGAVGSIELDEWLLASGLFIWSWRVLYQTGGLWRVVCLYGAVESIVSEVLSGP